MTKLYEYAMTRAEVEELLLHIAELRKSFAAQNKEIAQYKEWHEATQRQLAKRYAQISELTERNKTLVTVLKCNNLYTGED